MTIRSTKPLRTLRTRQRGSILVNVAVGLSVMIILLSVIDLGFLFYYKREYQKTADLAALAGAQRLRVSCAAGQAAAIENAQQNLAGRIATVPPPECGIWSPTTTPLFALNGANADAVRVTILGGAPQILPYIGARQLSATAIARTGKRRAALNLRSTLVSVDTAKSNILNPLFGGLLGGNVTLTTGGWNGLLNTDINLLKYLDQLAINLGVQAGSYDQLLQTNASVGKLIDAAIDVLTKGGGTGDVSAAIGGLQSLRAAIPAGTPVLALGELINVQSGTLASGLDADLDVFQLAQAFVQAANSKNAVVANLTVPPIGNVKIKVIEPPQISAIGDPKLASENPDGPNRIYVRTAQVRTLVSLNLPALSPITGLANAVLNVLAPATTLLNTTLSLNLKSTLTGLLGSLLGIPYEVTDIQLLPSTGAPPVGPRVDISLDAGGGDAKVTDYSCAPSGKSLTSSAHTSVVNLRVGKLELDPTKPGSVFASNSPPAISPLPLIDIGVKTCKVFLALLSSCQARRPFEGGGIGLAVSSDVAGSSSTPVFVDPPELDEPPDYKSLATQNVVSSLSNTLGGVQLQQFRPASGGGLGAALSLFDTAFNTLKGILQPIITGLLSPLLDPLVNFLLDNLGLDLAKLEVGGQMTCGGEAVLVN